MMYKPNRLAVKLKPSAEKSIKQGHPWVFSTSIEKISEGKTGDLAILFDQNSNSVFAIGLYDPGSPVAVKIIHHGGPQKIDTDFFRKKIEQAFQLREPLLQTQTNAYRLLFGENDGFPGLITDIYNKTAVLKLYSPVWFPYLEMLTLLIVEITNTETAVLRLSRKLQQKDSGFSEGMILAGNLETPVIYFTEHQVNFKANVLLGHKTGFFLDHRANRKYIGELARNKTVLDVFAYAGGFSVHALAGGAREVTSLDISNQALELAVENAKLNASSGKHITMAGDAFENLEKLIREKKQYDLVIIDPPSFAKNKKEIPLAKKKYAQLAGLGAALTKKGGLLLLASCSSRIGNEELEEIHREEFHRQGIRFSIEKRSGHDLDHPINFPEGAYLKSIYYRIH